MAIRDTSTMLGPAVREAVDAMEHSERDKAAIRLALQYAELIDGSEDARQRAWALRWIGPLLLDALESLGCTPAARTKIKEGAPASAGPNRLAHLRAVRR